MSYIKATEMKICKNYNLSRHFQKAGARITNIIAQEWNLLVFVNKMAISIFAWILWERMSSDVFTRIWEKCAVYSAFLRWGEGILLWRIYAMQNCNIETRSRDYATVDEEVISPCRAEFWRVAHLVVSPCLLPGNRYKHLDDARVGKGHVTASAVTQQSKRFPACQIKGS
jgi:hypothetical protein